MGVMDFVKDAGEKIGIGKTKKQEEAAKAKRAKATKDLRDAQRKKAELARRAAAANAARKKAAEREKKLKEQAANDKVKEQEAEAAKAQKLEKYVRDLGLKVRGLNIRFDDGTAYVRGSVANRAAKERVILAIGNVEGVSQVRDTLKVAKARPATSNTQAARARRRAAGAGQTMHTVKSGDTLSKLAKRYLGDANRYPEIFKANQPMLKDPNLIKIGQVLRIPKR